MVSLISSFYSQSTWNAALIITLPVVADQLAQRVFSRIYSADSLGAATLVTSGATYLLLSRELPMSFKIGAPCLYLAYKTAQYYWSRKTPPDTGSKPPPRLATTPKPYHRDLPAATPTEKPPVVSETSAQGDLQINKERAATTTEPPAAVSATSAQGDLQINKERAATTTEPPAAVSATSTQGDLQINKEGARTPTELSVVVSAQPPADPPAKKKAAKKHATQMNASEAAHQAILRYWKIIEDFKTSEVMSLQVQVKPLPGFKYVGKKKGKMETFKARIRFGKTHVFQMGKTQVQGLNKAGCAVTENIRFFWIDIIEGNRDRAASSVNFLPLMMLDNLNDKTKEFSISILEDTCELILEFKDNQLARLKTFAKTIKALEEVETIRNDVLKPSPTAYQPADPNDNNYDALMINEWAHRICAKCYIVPFMEKT